MWENRSSKTFILVAWIWVETLCKCFQKVLTDSCEVETILSSETSIEKGLSIQETVFHFHIDLRQTGKAHLLLFKLLKFCWRKPNDSWHSNALFSLLEMVARRVFSVDIDSFGSVMARKWQKGTYKHRYEQWSLDERMFDQHRECFVKSRRS